MGLEFYPRSSMARLYLPPTLLKSTSTLLGLIDTLLVFWVCAPVYYFFGACVPVVIFGVCMLVIVFGACVPVLFFSFLAVVPGL